MMSPTEGVSSALAVARQRAEIELLRASADRERLASALNMTQAGDIQSTAKAGRYDNISLERDLRQLQVGQLKELNPVLLEQAREEVNVLKTSAARNTAQSLLSDAQRVIAEKDAKLAEDWIKLYESLGASGPYLRAVALIVERIARARR